MKRLWIFGILLLFFALSRGWAQPVRVVASTTDLAAVAREVGGDLISIETLCRGNQDPHEFEILASQVIIVQQAAVYLKVGLALDIWADKLIESAGNSKLIVVDCSRNISVIGGAEEANSSAHPFGNPHYWLAPSNLPIIAGTIRDALQKADPTHADAYAQNTSTFAARLDSALQHWKSVLAPCQGWGLVTSHPSWDYFARDFGLEIAGTVSRIPDAEPSPMALAKLEQTIRARGKVVFLREPFTSNRFPNVLAKDTGIPVMTAPSSVGAIPQAQNLWSQFDYLTLELAMQCNPQR